MIAHSLEATPEVLEAVAVLEHTPPDALLGRLEGRRFFRREVVESLLAAGELALRSDPRRAERLGLWGIVLSGRLETETEWVPPGLIRSLLLVAGARRLDRNFQGAEEALCRAAPFLAELVEEAAYARTTGLLRWEQGRLCEAAALLAEAGDRFAAAEQSAEEAVCLALQGLLAGERGDWERALAALLRALPRLGGGAHPDLGLHLRLALAEARAERGEYQAADAALESARPYVPAEAPNVADSRWLAFNWTEGRLALRAGRYEGAGRRLLPTRALLLAKGRLAEAALACLELALLGTLEGDPAAIPRLADDLAEAFAGGPQLPFVLQALYEIEEAVPGPPAETRQVAARAARQLRAAFRAGGMPAGAIPYP
jgi:hypothetical protein